jgi:peroxiredoxin
VQNLDSLPNNLPAPIDDGACRHLLGKKLPSIQLSATDGSTVNLAKLTDWVVVYCYPMTGKPDIALPKGWDEIPGARGCTPQACAFRDQYQELAKLTQVFGLSTQFTKYQQEAVARLHLPFSLLSDSQFQFTDALKLPMLEVDGKRLIKRLTIIAFDGVLKHYIYPVFPPDKNAEVVLDWLKQNV